MNVKAMNVKYITNKLVLGCAPTFHPLTNFMNSDIYFLVRRHKPGDFMAGYRIARAFLSGWTYVRVTLLSGQFCPPLEKFVE